MRRGADGLTYFRAYNGEGKAYESLAIDCAMGKWYQIFSSRERKGPYPVFGVEIVGAAYKLLCPEAADLP